MIKKIFCFFFSICLLTFSLCGCENTLDANDRGTPQPVAFINQNGYKIYWVEFPHGELNSEGEYEYDYTYNQNYKKTASDTEVETKELNFIDQSFVSNNGYFCIPFYHRDRVLEPQTLDKVETTAGQSIADAYAKGQITQITYTPTPPKKLMLISPYTLNYEIYDFEFFYANDPDTRLTHGYPVLYHLKSTPDGGFSAFLIGNATIKINSDGTTEQNTPFSFARWDSEGNRILTIDATSIYPYFKLISDVSDYVVAKNGNSYFYIGSTVHVISPEGEKLYSVEIPGTTRTGHSFHLTLDADGNAVYCYLKYTVNQRQYMNIPFDDENQQLGEEIPLSESITTFPQFAPGYDAFWVTSNGIQAVSGDGSPVTLLTWVEFDLTYNMVEEVSVVDADHIFIKVKDPSTDELRIGLFTTADIAGHEPGKTVNKTLIKLAYVASNDPQNAKVIENYVKSFNLQSENYRVEMVPYTMENDLSANNQLIKEILSGEVPDMILFDSDMAPEPFADLDIFRNLYDFMDKDAAYSRNAFVSCVLEPFENNDGELPYLTIQFGISTIAANKASAGKLTGWNIEELSDYASSLKKGAYLLDINGNTGVDNPNMLLRVLLPSTLGSYVDYENARFTMGDSLSTLLELCKTASVHRSPNGVAPTMYKDGTIAVRAVNLIDSVQDFLTNRYCFFSGDDLTYLGFPAEGDCGTVIVPMTCLAITKQCMNPDGAWEFIKSCLESQRTEWIYDADAENLYNSTFIPENGFSCSTQTLELMFETLEHYYFYSLAAQSKTNPDVLEIGGSVGGRHFAEDGGYQEFDQQIISSPNTVAYTITDEDKADLMELFDSITMVRSYDTELMAIIYEDAQYYFNGTKSLDETVKIINSRVKIKLSE